MHAIIIGGGPAGLAAGLGLSKKGFTIDILEKHKHYQVRGSTLGLQTNGVKALRQICNDTEVDALVEKGVPISHSSLPNGGVMLAWWTIHEFLQERVAEQSDKISLHMGMTLQSIDDTTDPTCVKVHCQEGDFQGDLVVAADGVHSQMRSILGLSPEKSTGFYVWRGSVIADTPPLTDLLNQGFRPLPTDIYGSTTVSVFNHHPKLPKRLNWAVSSPDPSIVPGKTTPWDLVEPHTRDNTYRDLFKTLFDRSAPEELTDSMLKSTIELPEQDGRGWGGSGRVTVIADAAHAIRPAAGQGISLAFEDVVVLCRKLQNNLPVTRDEWEKLILEFENERLPRVKRIAAEQDRIMAKLYKHGGDVGYNPSKEYMEWVARGV